MNRVTKLLLASFLTFCAFFRSGGAFECTTDDIFGRRKSFSCPRPQDDYDEVFCCGLSGNQECCDKDDLVEAFGTGVITAIVIGALILLASFILLCCCCCSGCYLYNRRQKRGVVLAAGDPKPNPQVNIYPNQGYTQVPIGYSTAPPGQIHQMPYGPGYMTAAPPPQPGFFQEQQQQQQPYNPASAAPYPTQPAPYPTQSTPSEYSKPPPYTSQ